VTQELPRLTTLERTVSKRPAGAVLIDTLQNAKGKPLACAYSIRPFLKAPASTPLQVGELEKDFSMDAWNMKNVPARVNKIGDLWGDFFENRQRLEDGVERLAGEGKKRRRD
jgi:bifunctional non-homologous end joining protein LigD